MNIPVFTVDAFSNGPFTGNPAAVCPLPEWLPDAVMQSIAEEHNLAETAFVGPLGADQHIRGFTPTVEVDLCGHATLASAHVIFRTLPDDQRSIRLFSRSGWLEVSREEEGRLTLNFPADPVTALEQIPAALRDGLGAEIEAAYRGKFDYLVCVKDQQTVAALKPDLRLLGTLPARGIIVTAPGEDCDFVSRFFGPAAGVDEDPVTGSIHAGLAPYWGARLAKTELLAYQASSRGGVLRLALSNQRVQVSGQARLYLQGQIFIPTGAFYG